ncbi:hypothetical protein DPSP01_005541 [Paraphaeosphaeria sporulosa]
MQTQHPYITVPPVINGTVNAMKAALHNVLRIDPWSEDAVKATWAPPPYDGVQRKLNVYSASKTEGEQAAWECMKYEKSGADRNSVLPT